MNAWIPDTFLIYGDTLPLYDLCDTRYLWHEQRFMLTHNKLDPKVYAVTKVQDLIPQGIIKITLKQDELDDVKDNVDLMICDYYSDIGEVVVKQQTGDNPRAIGFLWSAIIDEDGVLQKNHEQNHILHIAQTSYFNCEFFLNNKLQDVHAEWRIDYAGNSELTDKEKEHLCNLLVMRQIDKTTVSIRPSKANKLIGEKFLLTVQDENGDYPISIELEVQQ